MHRFPFDFGFVIRSPNKKIYGFSILVENMIGVIGNIGKACAENHINIINLKTSIINKELAHVFLAVDMTDALVEPSDFRSKLLGVEGVRDVEVINPILPGLLIDTTHYPLKLYGDTRSIAASELILWGIFVGLREQLGEPVAAVTLWNMGYGAGKRLWDLYRSFRGAAVRDVVELLRQVSMSTGWVSDFELVEYDPVSYRAVVRVWDNIECSIVGRTGKAESHYIRGILAGFFTKHFDTECQAFETRCISKDDPYCEYEIKPKVVNV
jgi:predicted hydrocarbon binding protein/predicted amino acid-binding ACT domain protein